MCHCSNTGIEWALNESVQKVNTGEENPPAAPARNQTCHLSIISLVHCQLSYPEPQLYCTYTYRSSPTEATINAVVIAFNEKSNFNTENVSTTTK